MNACMKDDIVREAHGLVESYGALDNNYFLFTSDHGFHLGQRNLGACKVTKFMRSLAPASDRSINLSPVLIRREMLMK